ncbi:MAG: cation diffusion facilitator family transporter [Actinomycetota bacterium]
MTQRTDRYKKIKWTLIWLLFANIGVCLAKGIVGYLTGTLGMVADAFHSLTDSSNNIVGLIAMNMADRPADEDHPYGHGKYETLATIAISGVLLIAAYNIVKGAIDRFASHQTPTVGVTSFVVMAVTIGINIGVATYEYRAGKKLGSDFLIADSLHTRSDIFVSLSVIANLIIIKFGYPIFDPIISLVIGVFIAKAGWDIIKRGSRTLTDKMVLDPAIIENVVLGIQGVKECHSIRTRGMSGAVYVDLHALVDPDMHTEEAHALATEIEESVKKKIDGVVDVVVHVEPFNHH